MNSLNIPTLALLTGLIIFVKGVSLMAQASPCHPSNPDFLVEKIPIPKSLKNKHIIGHLGNGKLLVRSSSGSGLKYFYVEEGKEPVHAPFEQPVSAIAALDAETFFCTFDNQKGLFKVRLNKQNLPVSSEPVSIPEWDAAIKHPFIFRLAISDYTACIFASQAKGRKDYDLFVSEIRSTNWQKPVPLAAINSKYDELYPTVGPDGMLFFSSDRPGNGCPENGKLSPWFALSDVSYYWKDPLLNPLPAPFASQADDLFVISLQENAGSGYFVSDRENNRFELFHFKNTATNCCDREPVNAACCELLPTYRALLIGCDRYDFIGEKGQLQWPVANIVELADVLIRDYGFQQVDKLENPTKQQILQKLASYQHLQKHEYLLVVFFGHGIPLPSVDDPRQCRLAASDGKPDGTDCLSAEEYEQALGGISKPRHILTVLDACFSGLFQPEAHRSAGVLGKRSRKVIASTSKYFTPDKSLFFKHFITRLKEGHRNPASTLTGKYIFDDIFDKMKLENYTPCYFHLLAESEGEFYFPQKKRGGE